jgi:uncharacterized protein (UPF0332 family)
MATPDKAKDLHQEIHEHLKRSDHLLQTAREKLDHYPASAGIQQLYYATFEIQKSLELILETLGSDDVKE